MNYVIVESSLLRNSPALALYAYELKNFSDPRLDNFRMLSIYCIYVDNDVFKDRYLCTADGKTLVAVFDGNTWAKIPFFSPGFYQPTGDAARPRIGDMDFVLYRGGKTVVGGKNVEVLHLLMPMLNDSTLVKMILHAPLEHFKHVWTSSNGEILVYEVK